MFYDTFVQLVLLGISNFFFLQFFQVKTTASIFIFFLKQRPLLDMVQVENGSGIRN